MSGSSPPPPLPVPSSRGCAPSTPSVRPVGAGRAVPRAPEKQGLRPVLFRPAGAWSFRGAGNCARSPHRAGSLD
ncbi:hypothetical protein CVT30_07190 [Streptomyces sp. AMCC400023]|nr:hypothetical protein CVT30_07190 [Streptomyces sp. AMCC400023]